MFTSFQRYLSCLFAVLFFVPAAVHAQPEPQELADLVSQKNSERITNIRHLSITISPENGSFFPVTTSTYAKINRDGRDVLISEDADMDIGVLSSSFDDQLPNIIRAAHTITEEILQGAAVYKIEVDDVEALNELGRDESDIGFDDDGIVVIRGEIWINRSELYPIRMRMNQVSEEGFEVTVTLDMMDYQNHHGLAIPHRLVMIVDGFQDQFTEEDFTMMREYIAEIEGQLQDLPEEKRGKMEEQLRLQLEQFEAMLNGDFEMQEMVFMVTDIQVNRQPVE